MINNVLVELFENKNVGIAWDNELGILFEELLDSKNKQLFMEVE